MGPDFKMGVWKEKTLPCKMHFSPCQISTCCAPDCECEKTAKEPMPMQVHEGLLASSSLGPSTPDTAEQGLGPRGGLQLGFYGLV